MGASTSSFGSAARSPPLRASPPKINRGRGGVADSETLCGKCRWRRHRRCLTGVRHLSHPRGRTGAGLGLLLVLLAERRVLHQPFDLFFHGRPFALEEVVDGAAKALVADP